MDDNLMGAIDYLLVIDGVRGESQDSKHPGAIELGSFSLANANAGSAAHGGGGGAGKVSFDDLIITMKANRAGPTLFEACASGKHFAKAQLFARKQGGNQQDYLVITIEDFLVSSFQSDGSTTGDIVPVDQVMFNFAKIKVEYRPQNPDGTLGAPITTGWDQKQNKRL
jgi:type VI secretion system secreted protein Hcp